MKKIYLFLLFLIPAFHGFCQAKTFADKPYATWREGDPIRLLKSAETQTFNLKSASSGQIKVLLLTADDYATDVPTTLLATGKFSVVDLINYAVPTVAQLKSYDAVLVWANSDLSETIGDTLAAYIDGGGGVVSSVFNLFTYWGIESTRYYTDYRLMDLGSYSSSATLGTINIPGHPIMEGVNSLNNPNSFRSNSNTVTTGSVIVAEWSDGLPLVVIKEGLGPNNARRADVNIFPPSSNIRGDLWDATTDGGILLANALIWVSGKGSCPKDITVTTDSTSCGTIVDYTVTAPEKGSFVQTAGLPTGSEFPVGITTNCFLLTDSLGVESTCCFTVTVVDSIAPSFNCLPDITVPADSGKDCAQVYFNTNAIISGVAQEGITLACGAGTPLGVAYNPLKELYYTTGGGYNQAGLLTFDKNGNLLHDNYAGFDFRGLWWNPNINSLEGNGYGNYSGYRTVDLDANGYALSTGINNPVGLNQPDEQSIGDYDYDLNQVVFYNEGKIYKYDRNTGTLIETLDITGLPGSFSNLNLYFAGFSGVKGAEIVVLDYVTKQVYFIDKTTGMFSTSVQLPSSAPTNDYYMTSIANGHIWISDNTVWHSYKIFDEGKVVDNCGNVDISFSTASGTCFPIGETKVTMTATDESGNSSVCEFTVTVEARETPAQLYCNPIDVTLDEFGKYKLDSLDILNITGRTIDSLTTFNDLKIYAYPDTFSCANTEWPVFVRITEYNGNHKKERCWAMVTVHDFTPPTITGNNIELSLDETGQAILTTQMVTDSTVFDACGIDTISLDKSIFTCDDLGENTVVLTATDVHGNMATDTILVTITDSQVPVVEPVTDLEITVAPGVCWTTIEYPVPVINDNCTYTLTQTGGLGHDAQFPIGTTTESWIVTDAAGNSAEIEFNVIIIASNALPLVDTPSEVTQDEDTPEIIIPITGISYGNDCKNQTVELTAVSDNNELISEIEVAYTDGESEAELKLTIAPDMNGTAKVTLTVKDEMEGMIYKTFNINILPINDAPVVVKQVEDQIVNASYVLKVPVSSALGELFDDVDGDVLTLTAMMENGTPLPAWAELVGDELICSPMIEDKGNYIVVVKATDPDGASATDTFVVIVDGYPVSTPSIDAGFDIAMYPNPTAGRVQIELKNSGSKIEIAVFSITGSEVFRNTYYNTHLINLNMSDKGSGVYLVKINVDSENVIKKLVVDKK